MRKLKISQTGKLALLIFVCNFLTQILLGVLILWEHPEVDIANTFSISLTASHFIIDCLFRNLGPIVTGCVALKVIRCDSFKTVFGAYSLTILSDLLVLVISAWSGISNFIVAYPVVSVLSLLLPPFGVLLVLKLGKLMKRELSYPKKILLYLLYLALSSFVF